MVQREEPTCALRRQRSIARASSARQWVSMKSIARTLHQPAQTPALEMLRF